MKAPTFRGKPTESHVIWREGSGTGGEKTFDESKLKQWCSAVEADYETGKRVDHGRGDDPREQYRCVFTWTDEVSESFAMGDDEWEMTARRTPHTFIEVDERGVMRVHGVATERVVDVEELWVEDRTLALRTADRDGVRRLDPQSLRPG